MVNSVAIIGASRGIGLGFVQSYAADGWKVHATIRSLEKPGAIDRIQGDIKIHRLDVRDGEQILALAEEFKGREIDVLIHNAGVFGKGMTHEDVMAINAEAPFNVINALLPTMLRGKMKKVAVLTSQMGARNGGPTPTGLYGHSKCVLNDRFREIELTWRKSGITAIVFHPGWVRTDMGGRFAPLSVEKSVTGMRNVIKTLAPTASGSFFTWKGKIHPW